MASPRGFVSWTWLAPLPPGLDDKKAGPLLCGGITVFNPIVELGIQPTDSVAVIGIGGLGHMALKFLRAWGCASAICMHNAFRTGKIKVLDE